MLFQVGCGGAAIDYLASVVSYPKPDDKIRTTALEVILITLFAVLWSLTLSFQVQGGGNVGNALTAAARLGLKTRIVTKVLLVLSLGAHSLSHFYV